jgi:nicotinate-nucleotide pyrophosphorylase (carboxylating)
MQGRVEPPPERSYRELLRIALAEDLGPGDVTTPLVIPAERRGRAVVEAREPLVTCGLDVAEAVFLALDPRARCERRVAEGDEVAAGQPLLGVSGQLAALLAAERTALNFLMRLCGVASHTRRFVRAVADTGAAIVDTRKTLPGWRALDKYATAVGGARNHRVGLFDGILLKDNHVAAAGGVALAVKAALANAPANLRVQVEVESLEDAVAAVEAGADFLLLDNQTPEQARAIALRLAGRALLEISGGVNLDNVRAMAETGVQRISIGALTHSAPAADVALEIVPEAGDGAGGVTT